MSMGNRRYSFTGALTASASKTRAMLVGAATIRVKTNFLMLVAANATPNDYHNEYTFKRGTSITSTANTTVTPNPLDTLDAATSVTTTSTAATGINCTVEPATYTASSELLWPGHNMHAVFAWYAPDGGEITQPATAVTFMGLFFVGGTTAFNDQMTWHFSE